MHELSLCNSIHDIVDRAAAGRRVSTIHLQVGQLRQVVPETLRYCWSLVSEQTALTGSELRIEHVPVTLTCTDCGRITVIERTLVLLCANCSSGRVCVTTGEEFLLTSLELSEV